MYKKGLKIHTDKIHFDKEWHEYTVHLRKDAGDFFINTKDEELLDLIKNAKIDSETWRNYNDVERAVKRVRDEYLESKIEKIAETHKVLLFVMEMDFHVKKYDEDGDWTIEKRRTDFSMSHRNPSPQLKFSFRKAMRVDMDGETIRYHQVDNKESTVHVNHDEKEIPWTQEAEDLFTSLHSGLLGLCVRLDEFFGEENEDVVKNLESFTGNLLGFSDNSESSKN